MHLFGFIIRIYHDARSTELQVWNTCVWLYSALSWGLTGLYVWFDPRDTRNVATAEASLEADALVGSLQYRYALLNDGDMFWEMSL